MGRFVRYDEMKDAFLSDIATCEAKVETFLRGLLVEIEAQFDGQVHESLVKQFRGLLAGIMDADSLPPVGAIALMFKFPLNFFVVRLYGELDGRFVAAPEKDLGACGKHEVSSDFGALITLPFEPLTTWIDFSQDEDAFEDVDISDEMLALMTLSEAKVCSVVEACFVEAAESVALVPNRFCETVLVYVDQHDGGMSDLIATLHPRQAGR